MQFLRIFKLLTVSVLCLCVGQSCTKKKAVVTLKPQNVLIDANFTSQSINEQVLVSTKFSQKDLNKKDLKAWFKSNSEKVSQQKDAIFMGNFRKYPHAWFYTQIVNTTNVSQQLVVDEFNRVRCDAFEVLTLKNGDITNRRSIDRTTPFKKYPLQFFTYAVPINILPKDTLNLLIHTQRNYGAHELNLGISTYETYLSKHIVIFLSKILQIIVFIICALGMLILGIIFKFRKLLYLSWYIVSFLFVNVTSWGFTDGISNFTSIGLSGNNVSIFSVLIVLISGVPFVNSYMDTVPKNETLYKGSAYLFNGLSLIGIISFLMPVGIFNQIYFYLDLTFLTVTSTLIAIIWALFYSFWAFYKSRIYYLIIGFGVALLPIGLTQFLSIFNKKIYLLEANQTGYFFIAVGFSVLSIYQLREQFVTRKKLEENILHLKETMDDIRKSEVETIGRNLHDQVGNTLASALGYLNLKTIKVNVMRKLIMDSINEIRFLSHSLVKEEDTPLTEKIELLVMRFSDFSSIKFQFSDFSDAKIDSLELLNQQNIYMIVQEIMTNIIKHSKASEVFIQIFENEKSLSINIEDDGIGMENLDENKGIGLKNIQKRAEISKLKITIDSTPNGTNFIIEIPNGNSNNNH